MLFKGVESALSQCKDYFVFFRFFCFFFRFFFFWVVVVAKSRITICSLMCGNWISRAAERCVSFEGGLLKLENQTRN